MPKSDHLPRYTLVFDERFGTRDKRVKYFRELNELIEMWTSTIAALEIVAKLHEANIPAAEVRGPRAAVRDPRVVSRRDTVPLFPPIHDPAGDIYGMGLPVKFSAATAGFDGPPPALGQHNETVYGGILGYDAGLIEELRSEGAI